MTNDPYTILGVDPQSDDATIRKRYLELVRQYPPEQEPRRFAEIRAAYECIRDLDRRVQQRLFQVECTDTIEAIIEECQCVMTRRRPTLKTLLDLPRTPT